MGLPPQVHGEFVETAAPHTGVSPFFSIAIALVGAILGITSSIIFVGGSLRQVDIDTRRLDQIEAHGSPQAALLAQQIQALDLRLERVVNWVKDFPKADLDHAVALATVKAEINDLQAIKADVAVKLLDLQQRSAKTEQASSLMDARVTRAEARIDRNEADLAASRNSRQLIPPR